MLLSSVGGDDILSAGDGGNVLFGDAVELSDSSEGGDDSLTATGDNNTLYGDGDFLLEFSTGGDDTLSATGDDNVLWGDAYDISNTATGGADTFVFGSANGKATIGDFRNSDGDQIDLTTAVDLSGIDALSWDDLDTNGNNILDAGDDFVDIGAYTDIGVAGDDTQIDLGAAAGGSAGVNLITIAGVTGMIEGDFVFL